MSACTRGLPIKSGLSRGIPSVGSWVAAIRGADGNFCSTSVQFQPQYQNARAGNTLPNALQHERNELPWTRLIKEHTKNGQGREALKLYSTMLEEGILPKTYTFVAALKACSSLADLESGKHIHAHAISHGCHTHMFVANTLLDMYAKCSSIVEAHRVFEHMPHRDVVSWNTIIMGYAHMEMGEPALQLYTCMQHQGFLPNDRTFVAALKACCVPRALEASNEAERELIKLRCLKQGRSIHAQMAKSGFELNIFVANTLIDMYAKCGSILDARQVFEQTSFRDSVSWTAMIVAYTGRGEGEVALQLYERMQLEGIKPDSRTFVATLKACGSLAEVDLEVLKVRCFEQGRSIHAQLTNNGLESDIFVANTLIDMYAKCGGIIDARQIFERVPYRNVVSWNAMIMGYAQMGMGESALELFARMEPEGFTPDAHTFAAVLKACASMAMRAAAKEVDFEQVKTRCLEIAQVIKYEVANNGLEADMHIASTLIDLYSKCGNMVDACQVFDRMPYRDVISWNAMIMGYAQMEMGGLALELFERMQHEGFKPDSVTFVAALKACGGLGVWDGEEVDYELMNIKRLETGRAIHSQVIKSRLDSKINILNTLLDLYAKCGSIFDARLVFEKMPHRDVVSWNAMIMGYAHMEMGRQALKLYTRMQHEGFTPNARTFVAALKACCSIASFETGKEIHDEICRVGVEGDIFVSACLIDMYGKLGSMLDTQRLFDSMPLRNLVAWNALISGYSGQGDSKHVFDLFNKMQKEGTYPDGVTFISILNACSHSGLVDKGQMYFQAMCSEYGINPSSEHYSCIIDLLGRASQLDKAVAMVMKIPFKLDKAAWMAILSACRKWNNVEIGRHAFDCVISLDAKHSAAYLVMMSIYVSANMWQESAKIQEMRLNT